MPFSRHFVTSIPLVLLLYASSSCASVESSMLLGAGIGASMAGSAGNLATNHSAQGTAAGALVGAALGAAIGYVAHRDFDERARVSRTMQSAHEVPKEPRLTPPKYRSIWVPAKIEGDHYIDGHRVYIIEDSGKWTE